MAGVTVSKVGTLYETVYYYKQRSVNWEFITPTSYECMPHVVFKQTSGVLTNTSFSLHAQSLLSIQVTAYFDEQGYNENAFKYDVSIYNVTTPFTYINIASINNSNLNINSLLQGTNVGKLLYANNVFQTTLTFNDATVTYPVIDSIICNINIPHNYTRNIKKQEQHIRIPNICFLNKIKDMSYISDIEIYTSMTLKTTKTLLSITPFNYTYNNTINSNMDTKIELTSFEISNVSLGLKVFHDDDFVHNSSITNNSLYKMALNSIAFVSSTSI